MGSKLEGKETARKKLNKESYYYFERDKRRYSIHESRIRCITRKKSEKIIEILAVKIMKANIKNAVENLKYVETSKGQ